MNHAEKANIGGMLGNAGIQFLSTLVNAKKDGMELPGFLDKLAEVAIQGEGKAIEIAQKEAKRQTISQMSWIIVGVLTVVIVILLIKRKS